MFMFTQQNRAEVPSQLVEDSAEVLRGEHLASDQEEDTDGCKPEDANSDGHCILVILHLMTQVVMVIMASARLEKNSSRGRPFSPMLARDTPRMIAKKTRPRMLEPEVHSPLNFQVRVLLGSRSCSQSQVSYLSRDNIDISTNHLAR